MKESSRIFWGIDNMEFYHGRYPVDGFIPADVVFPLRKGLFEGEYFWVPNDAEEMARHELGDIWAFPDDVGLQRHHEIDEK